MSMVAVFRPASDEQLEELFARPETIEELLGEPSSDEMDIDKAWHGLHYLLTSTAWAGEAPFNFIAAGGREVGVDLGYGPARGFTASEVEEIDRELKAVSADDLRARFEPQKMKDLDIYPDIWDRDPAEDDTLAYLLVHFEALTKFVSTTAGRSSGFLVYLA